MGGGVRWGEAGQASPKTWKLGSRNMVLKMQAAFKHWRCLPGRRRWVPADLTGWPPGRALSRQSALAQYPVQNANQSWLPRRRTLTSTLPPHFISSWQCLLSALPRHLNLCSEKQGLAPLLELACATSYPGQAVCPQPRKEDQSLSPPVISCQSSNHSTAGP